jgi:hypothetical protein
MHLIPLNGFQRETHEQTTTVKGAWVILKQIVYLFYNSLEHMLICSKNIGQYTVEGSSRIIQTSFACREYSLSPLTDESAWRRKKV